MVFNPIEIHSWSQQNQDLGRFPLISVAEIFTETRESQGLHHM